MAFWLARTAMVALLSLAASLPALAHEGGHGPPIEGVGANGGLMTAVVAAVDSELGEKAPVQGVAEWLLENGKLTVYLSDSAREKSLEVKPGEMKWILLLKAPEKPVVIKTELVSAQSVLNHTFDADLLSRIEVIECILPNFNGRDEKHVFAFETH